MRTTILAVTLAMCLLSAPATAATVTGELYINGSANNAYDYANGQTLSGHQNNAPGAWQNQTIAQFEPEFGAKDITYGTYFVDLTDSIINVGHYAGNAHGPFMQVFTFQNAFSALSLSQNSFAGFDWTSSGNTLTINWDGTEVPREQGTYFASFDYTLGTAAVPEPSTWLLLILGLGFVAAEMRRTRLTVRYGM